MRLLTRLYDISTINTPCVYFAYKLIPRAGRLTSEEVGQAKRRGGSGTARGEVASEGTEAGGTDWHGSSSGKSSSLYKHSAHVIISGSSSISALASSPEKT